MDAAQLEATCSWKSKTAAEVAAVSKVSNRADCPMPLVVLLLTLFVDGMRQRPGDMIGFLAAHNPNTPLQVEDAANASRAACPHFSLAPPSNNSACD